MARIASVSIGVGEVSRLKGGKKRSNDHFAVYCVFFNWISCENTADCWQIPMTGGLKMVVAAD